MGLAKHRAQRAFQKKQNKIQWWNTITNIITILRQSLETRQEIKKKDTKRR